jgi:hypothetical protein
MTRPDDSSKKRIIAAEGVAHLAMTKVMAWGSRACNSREDFNDFVSECRAAKKAVCILAEIAIEELSRE